MKIIFKFILIITIFIGIEVNALYKTDSNFENKFRTEKYNVKLNGNGGTFNKQNNIIVFKNRIKLPTPIKKGYNFSHYSSTDCDYLTEIDDINKINNKELIAKWKLRKYQIMYDLNGGYSNELLREYTKEDEFILPMPQKKDSKFLGWSTNDNFIPIKEYKILKGTTGDLYFKANWENPKYKVKVISIIDNVKYNYGNQYYTFNVWIDEKLVKENIYYFEEEIESGKKIRIQTIKKDGIETNYDKTITIGSEYNFYPEWTIKEYDSEFYVGKHLAGITKNKFGAKVGTPAINLENFGYSNYFFYISGFTPRESWYQKPYTLYFDTNIEEFPCMTSFGSQSLNNAYQQLNILQQNGITYCGVNPKWNAVECHGNATKILNLYNNVWNYLPYSGNGYSRYKQISCNSGYSTYYNR